MYNLLVLVIYKGFYFCQFFQASWHSLSLCAKHNGYHGVSWVHMITIFQRIIVQEKKKMLRIN